MRGGDDALWHQCVCVWGGGGVYMRLVLWDVGRYKMGWGWGAA